MDTMALTRLAAPRKLRVTLTAGPAAVAAARNEVRAAIRAWDVPVASSVAVQLTSELVASALRRGAGNALKPGAGTVLKHGAGTAIELVVSCAYGQLQVDVYDTSPARVLPVDAPSGAERPGPMLLASLSTSWGYYQTRPAMRVSSRSCSEPVPAGRSVTHPGHKVRPTGSPRAAGFSPVHAVSQ